jgi:hypothetical protein
MIAGTEVSPKVKSASTPSVNVHRGRAGTSSGEVSNAIDDAGDE